MTSQQILSIPWCYHIISGIISGVLSNAWTQFKTGVTLFWRHNGGDDVSNHQPHDCLLDRSFRRRSKKTSKLRVTELCAGNSQVTGEFPAQKASNAENVSIWWGHREMAGPVRLSRLLAGQSYFSRKLTDIIINFTTFIHRDFLHATNYCGYLVVHIVCVCMLF